MDGYEFTFNQTINGDFRFYHFGQVIPALAGVAGPFKRALVVFQTHYPHELPVFEPRQQMFVVDDEGHLMRRCGGQYERSYWEGERVSYDAAEKRRHLVVEAELLARCRDLARLTASYMELVHQIELDKDPKRTSANIGEWVLATHNTRPLDVEPSSVRDMCTTPKHSDAMTYLKANLASGAFGAIWRRFAKD